MSNNLLEVKNLKKGYIYWIELEFYDLNDIFLNGGLLDHSANFISAKKATDNEITEYFFLDEEDYSEFIKHQPRWYRKNLNT